MWWLWDGFANALRMAWEVWWALVLGFALSGIVQAWVPRARLRSALGGRGAREAALATGLGAASSSCSYAAIAIAKSLFEKGASLASAMAFQFASTNLVFELGIVLWLFIGWRFTLAEFVGGLVLIGVMWIALRLLVTREREEEIRTFTAGADAGHVHATASSDLPLRRKLLSVQAWSDVAHNFRGDWQMLWKEIGAGFLIAGYVSLLPSGFFNGLFVTDAPAPFGSRRTSSSGRSSPRSPSSARSGTSHSRPCLVGRHLVLRRHRVPLRRPPHPADRPVLPQGVRPPVRSAPRRGHVRLAIIASLVVDALFSLAGLVPTHRPSVDSITDRPVTWNYTSVLDILFALVFVALFGLTFRRGARDPVCGMAVDRHSGNPTSVYAGKTWFFCGDHCKHRFDEQPEAFSSRSRGAATARPTSQE